MSSLNILVTVPSEATERYQTHLAAQEQFVVHTVASDTEARAALAGQEKRTDILIVDNALDGVFELIRDSRQTYPRLLIILVDEEADFLMPGRADDVSTDPFIDNDLVKRIFRLLRERETETLRADSLPPVRAVAKALREATGVKGKAGAVVEAVHELGYDFVGYYCLEDDGPPLLLLAASGPQAITSIVPQKQNEASLVGWVAENGQLRIVGPEDEPNFSLVKRGRLGAGACVPVGSATRYGVLLACREQPESITHENAMVLELIGGQLAVTLARELKV